MTPGARIHPRRLTVLALACLAYACATPGSGHGVMDPVVHRAERFEVAFHVPGVAVPSTGVRTHAAFTAPSGRVIRVEGFPAGADFKVRFAPQEVGDYRYEIFADGDRADREVSSGRFRVLPGSHPGYARIDPKDPRQVVLDDGSAFHPLGENRINIFDPSWNYGQKDIASYIAYMALNGMNTLRVFVFSDCEHEEGSDRNEPGCLEPAVGRFDETVAERFDTIMQAAEQHGIYVIINAFAIGFTPSPDTWKSWEDNPYNARLGGPAKTRDEFFTSPAVREAAKGRLRYLLARYGYSPNLLAIDLLNEPEWDGPIPENTWIPWAEEMAATWRREDPYGHLVTAGPVGLKYNYGGDERPWYADRRDDIVQWHLYGEEFYEPHALGAETTRRVRETWSNGKPVLCGEFAYGGEDKATYDHTHVGIWSLLMSGAGAIAHSAPPFQLDSDELMTPERAHHFRVLSDFLTRVDWRQPLEPHATTTDLQHSLGVWSLERRDYRVLWVLAPREGYGQSLANSRITLRQLPSGRYRVRWWNDVTGEPLPEQTVTADGTDTELTLPTFVRHVAGIVERVAQQ